GANVRQAPGRPRRDKETENVRIAKENPGWGYDRIVGALANLRQQLSDQTFSNILRRHDRHGVCWKTASICSMTERVSFGRHFDQIIESGSLFGASSLEASSPTIRSALS